MDIIEILEDLQISLKWASSNGGGQHSGPCPYCNEGDNRFCVWPMQQPEKGGRFWCRQCDKKGDAIQLLRDFKNMGFKEACGTIGHSPSVDRPKVRIIQSKPILEEVFEDAPCLPWVERATGFALSCHEALLSSKKSPAINELERRRITIDTAKKFKLGWNPGNKYPYASDWGLVGENFQGKKLILAKGLVIPSLWGNSIERLRVRRTDWKKDDGVSKYIIVQGSRVSPCLIGEPNKYLLVVESELDGMIVNQEIPQIPILCLGSSTTSPTLEIASLVRECEKVVFIPDIDEAGAKVYAKWKNHFCNVSHAVVPFGGSLGGFHEQNGNVLEWIRTVL